MNNSLIVFADVDEYGNITNSSIGSTVVPTRQWACFVYLASTELTAEEILGDYRIINGELVRKEAY